MKKSLVKRYLDDNKISQASHQSTDNNRVDHQSYFIRPWDSTIIPRYLPATNLNRPWESTHQTGNSIVEINNRLIGRCKKFNCEQHSFDIKINSISRTFGEVTTEISEMFTDLHSQILNDWPCRRPEIPKFWRFRSAQNILGEALSKSRLSFFDFLQTFLRNHFLPKIFLPGQKSS